VLRRVGAEGLAATTWRRVIDPAVASIWRCREVRRSGNSTDGPSVLGPNESKRKTMRDCRVTEL
jgi:hypothetical protein